MSPVLLQNRDWLIEPDALRAMAVSAEEARGRDASSLSKPGNPLLQVEDGIGTVAIEGPILRKPDLFARLFMGATDSEEIGIALREAAGREDVRAVFLDIDSPGGTVAGTPELAAAVSALNEKKPVYAFSAGLMCSAAYWIASQARAIYATPSARAESLTTERDSALEQVTNLNARVAELEASQADFDAEVARVVASTGHTSPAQVTPSGDGTPSAKPTLEELVAQYDQLVSDRKPEEAAAFFNEHLAQHFNR